MHRTLVLVNESHQNTDGCRLPSAVRPDEAHDASRGKLKVDVLKGKVRVFLAHSRKMNGEVLHKRSFVNRLAISRSMAARNREVSSSGVRPSNIPSRTTCSRCSANSWSYNRGLRSGSEATIDPLPCCVTMTPSRSSSK